MTLTITYVDSSHRFRDVIRLTLHLDSEDIHVVLCE